VNEGTQVLWVPGPLPSLNQLLAGRSGGAHNPYAAIKKKWTADIAILAKAAKLRPMTAARLRFVWHEKHKRRNPDNFVAGGRKLVLDGLVTAGVLPNDGWAEIVGFVDLWLVSATPGVMVYLHPHDPSTEVVDKGLPGGSGGGGVFLRGNAGTAKAGTRDFHAATGPAKPQGGSEGGYGVAGNAQGMDLRR
jgi:hypothetical protein